jgi:hypothetical protein
MKPVAPVSAMSRLFGDAVVVAAILRPYGPRSPAQARQGDLSLATLDLACHLGEFSSVRRRILPSASSVKA